MNIPAYDTPRCRRNQTAKTTKILNHIWIKSNWLKLFLGIKVRNALNSYFGLCYFYIFTKISRSCPVVCSGICLSIKRCTLNWAKLAQQMPSGARRETPQKERCGLSGIMDTAQSNSRLNKDRGKAKAKGKGNANRIINAGIGWSSSDLVHIYCPVLGKSVTNALTTITIWIVFAFVVVAEKVCERWAQVGASLIGPGYFQVDNWLSCAAAWPEAALGDGGMLNPSGQLQHMQKNQGAEAAQQLPLLWVYSGGRVLRDHKSHWLDME